MERIRKIAAINDLSGASRCSLTVALPLISALGIQCMVMPTAILSNHTGYDDFYFRDFTDGMAAFLEKWKNMGLKFDCIYSGFLGSHSQVETVLSFIKEFGDEATKIIIDPVMGDNGEIYSTYSKELCDDMKKLVSGADIVTPNITEASVLSAVDYPGESPDEKTLFCMAEKISFLGAKNVVITGHRSKSEVSNFVYSKGECKSFANKIVPKYFSGTGDVFASIVAGLTALGEDIFSAVEFAAEFAYEATSLSYELGLDIKEGICFEKLMPRLLDYRKNKGDLI